MSRISPVSKEVWRKRKEMLKIRNGSLLPVKQYKNCCWRTFWRTCVIRKNIPKFCWSIIMMEYGAMYVPLTKKIVSANHLANKSYSRSSSTRIIEVVSHCNEQKTRYDGFHHTPCQPNIPVDGLCYKMGWSIHQFYKKYFHLPQNCLSFNRKKTEPWWDNW